MTSPKSRDTRRFAMRVTVSSAVTVALLIGASNLSLAQAPDAAAGQPTEHTDKAIAVVEAAVAKMPQDAVARAALGHAYLRVGRFEAAENALHDAMALGDASGRTTLALALAQIACGRTRAALATLDRGATMLAPADLGLALALAGNAERGVAVLTDAVRDGPPSPGLRENLAYAYALAGRWADARLTASFDLSPDQVDARLRQWAQSMQSGGERVRIARLLNVPATVDRGMPLTLALRGTEVVPPSVPASAKTASAEEKTASAEELPPLELMPAVAIIEPMVLEPHSASAPLVRPIAAWQPPVHRPAIQRRRAAPSFDHAVQLGAFSSASGAQRAQLILVKRNPQLRGHGFLITQAIVNGHAWWRVATAAFDGSTALATCSSLKHRGGVCFAYALRHASQRQAPEQAALDPSGMWDGPQHRIDATAFRRLAFRP